IVDFEETANPWDQLWRQALPDHRRMDPIDIALTILWAVGLMVACVVAWRSRGPSSDDQSATRISASSAAR
ncbi:MAG: hypothetical protein AAFO29_20955, partial [Actinomycetota bacterium]